MFIIVLLVLFSTLIAVHGICDFPLQGQYMAEHKSPRDPYPPNEDKRVWWVIMGLHSTIHGLGVFLVLEWYAIFHDNHSLMVAAFVIATLETLTHFCIDYWKCTHGRALLLWDQVTHISCKAMWVILFFGFLGKGAPCF